MEQEDLLHQDRNQWGTTDLVLDKIEQIKGEKITFDLCASASLHVSPRWSSDCLTALDKEVRPNVGVAIRSLSSLRRPSCWSCRCCHACMLSIRCPRTPRVCCRAASNGTAATAASVHVPEASKRDEHEHY